MKLHHSGDGGATWSERTVPEYPKPPDGAEPDRCPVRGIEMPWRLNMIWVLESADESDGQTLWCGTIPGGLFHSGDRGDSWRLVRSLWDAPQRRKWFGGGYDYSGIHSVCVDPRDASKVAVGVSCGGVWVTRDGGESWQCRAIGMRAAYMPPDKQFDPNIQDPHRLVQCRDHPQTMWVEHHNGIFRSTDGAASWTEITEAGPSTFGFAVAVHPHEPDTAWFVPGISDEQRIAVDGKFVVTRTRDGGDSFDVLTDGLPQHDAYDLVYRHGLDADAQGQRLAMGSTTGSLWLSENQGDSWQCVTNHLPPVFAVRFA